MALCLAAGLLSAALTGNSFTLAWTHSIEKIRWEEDWLIENGRLRIVEARVRGSGAGMEPPPDAVLRQGVWHYRPALAPLDELLLAHSPAVASFELCRAGVCRPLADHLPGLPTSATLRLAACLPYSEPR